MTSLKDAANDFLAQKRIAVVGVSRDSKQPANLIFRTLKKSGHEVFAVNRDAEEVESVPCFRDLKSIRNGIDAVMVVTPANAARDVVAECGGLGISRVWLHRAFGQGSASDDALNYGREHGIDVIPGGCPMMFVPGTDVGHRCMRWVLGLSGRLPKNF